MGAVYWGVILGGGLVAVWAVKSIWWIILVSVVAGGVIAVLWKAAQSRDDELLIRAGPRSRFRSSRYKHSDGDITETLVVSLAISTVLTFLTLLTYWLLPDFYTYYAKYHSGYTARREKAHEIVQVLEKENLIRVDAAWLQWLSDGVAFTMTTTVTNTGTVPVYDASVTCELTIKGETRRRDSGTVVLEPKKGSVTSKRDILRLLPGQTKTITIGLARRNDTDKMLNKGLSNCTTFYSVRRDDIVQIFE